MNNILYTLFQDNPELTGEIYRFCRSLPDYCQAEREFDRMAEEASRLLGGEKTLEFEAVLNGYLAHMVRAYYLFGLGLRRGMLE